MPERINGGQALVVVGAIALIVSLFGDWFQPGLTAWTVFESIDLLLAALAVAALAIAVSGAISPKGSLAALAPRWLPVIGIAALVLVVAALVNHPPAAIGRSADTGAWVALGAAAALTVGGILGATRVSLVITLRPREAEAELSDPSAAGGGQSRRARRVRRIRRARRRGVRRRVSRRPSTSTTRSRGQTANTAEAAAARPSCRLPDGGSADRACPKTSAADAAEPRKFGQSVAQRPTVSASTLPCRQAS